MRRAALTAVAAAALVVGGAGPASATPFLDAADAEALVRVLAEASAVQGVCYGWSVEVSDSSGGPSGTDAGSGRGVGPPPSELADCPRYVEVRAVVRWTAETSDAEDSAGFTIRSSGLDDPPTASELRSVVGFDDPALAGDDGDTRLFEAVTALPRLVADTGAVPSVTLAPAPTPPPAGSRPTGSPALPDWARQRPGLLVLGGVLLLAAVAVAVLGAVARRGDRRRTVAAGPPGRPGAPDRTGPPSAGDRPRPTPQTDTDRGAS